MKRLIIFSICLLFPKVMYSQLWKAQRYEASLGVGTSHYFGDIGGYSNGENLLGLRDFSIRYSRPVMHMGALYKIQERVAIRLNLNFGWISGSDIGEGKANYTRSYQFHTFLFEPSLQGQYFFVKDKQSYLAMKGRAIRNFTLPISAYVFAGIGMVTFKPHPNELLEARVNEDFSTIALALPVGLGVRYSLTGEWVVGLDIGARITTTDYIDNFTSTTYSKAKDIYYFGLVTGSYKLKTSKKGWPVF